MGRNGCEFNNRVKCCYAGDCVINAGGAISFFDYIYELTCPMGIHKLAGAFYRRAH